MTSVRTTPRMTTLGRRHPMRIAAVRIAVGIWLLILTAILLHNPRVGGWAWCLAPFALLHFALAARLVRIARRHGEGRPLLG